MSKCSFGLVLAVVLIAASLASASVEFAAAQTDEGAQSASAAYSRIEPSLALIVARNGNTFVTGTGFCIGSRESVAYLLTNRHVVGSDAAPTVVLMSNRKALRGAVARVSRLDAAVIAVDGTNCTPIALSRSAPPVGTQIGIAGFPSFQVDLSSVDRLSPSFHAGSVSAMISSGALIEYDAQTDHGNSGSPLFDLATSTVYGLVTYVNTGSTGALQNNVAISVAALAPFLTNAVATVTYTSPGTLLSNSAMQANSATSWTALLETRCGREMIPESRSLQAHILAEEDSGDKDAEAGDARKLIRISDECQASLTATCPSPGVCEAPLVFTQQGLIYAFGRLSFALIPSDKDGSDDAFERYVSRGVRLCLSADLTVPRPPYDSARGTVVTMLRVANNIHKEVTDEAIESNITALRECAGRLGDTEDRF